MQACTQYLDSLQELEGILGSDTCSKMRNDPRLHALGLLAYQQPAVRSMDKMTVPDRPLSANAVPLKTQLARVTL